ncbi:metallophosphatase family protein [Balneolaceae bacterium]|nr:metallophosphatase family protein [Balneolaceae bacterium]
MKIGLISDTHSYFDPQLRSYFSDCDEIWHAGDFGTLNVAKELEKIAPLRGVYGNIDGQDIRQEYPLHRRFNCEGIDVWMTHIGGIPGRYCLPIRKEIMQIPPELFICGHSHILKIVRDKECKNMLYMNPGAAGKQGFHQYRTVVTFEINQGKLSDAQVVHLGELGKKQPL